MRGRILVQSVLTVAVAALMVGSQVPAPASADPVNSRPATLAEAKAQVEKLEDEVSQADEDYDQAKIALTDGQHKVDAMNKQISDQQKKVDQLTQQARAIALMQFQGRGVDTTLQVFTSSDPDSFLSQLSTTNKMDQNMNDMLQVQQLEQAKLVEMQRELTAQVDSLDATKQQAADLEKQIKQKLADAKAVVSQMTAAQQAALQASMSKSSRPSLTFSDADVSGTDANASAIKAVEYAVSKVGHASYVWGAAGPNAFDCSGLAMAAYRSVGVSLPHSSQAMSRVGRAVSRNELKPGDLLFWYNPVHHVSIYIGNGKMVHAANSRLDLRIDDVASWRAPFAGARRILG